MDESKIVEMYVQGTSVLNICKTVFGSKRNWEAIYKVLKRHGVYKCRSVTAYPRKYKFNEHYFDTIDSEAKAYLLGFVAADGFVDEVRKTLKISVNVQDIDVLRKFSAEISGGIVPVREFIKDGKYNHCYVEFCSVHMQKTLCDKGLYSGKSLTMDSKVYSFVPENLRRHFIRGYFDGDGCMMLGNKYSSGVKYVIDVVGTEGFLKETFVKFWPTKNKLAKYKSCDMYHYRVSSKGGVFGFLSQIYSGSTIYLDRKYNKFSAHLKPCELTGNPNVNDEGNQQPSISIETAGSTTIESRTQVLSK